MMTERQVWIFALTIIVLVLAGFMYFVFQRDIAQQRIIDEVCEGESKGGVHGNVVHIFCDDGRVIHFRE